LGTKSTSRTQTDTLDFDTLSSVAMYWSVHDWARNSCAVAAA
jgi:hypothetical protein